VTTAVLTSQDTALSARALRKAFGPTVALRDFSLDLRAGETHVLMGENGSGKSTVVKLLSGVHRPDSGSITIGDRSVDALPSPRAAIAAGISTVFQETLIVPQQTVLTNLWLGSDEILRRRHSAAARHELGREMLGRLVDPPELDAPAGGLSLRDRQAICIARALLTSPRLLILDESTSALDVRTRDNLFVVVRELCRNGAAVLFISHRMDEVDEIGDRITVLRSGACVASSGRGELDARQLVELMTGEAHAMPDRDQPVRARSAEIGAPSLHAAGVRLTADAPPIDATFRCGEIVGLAGLEGHGQDLFLQALAGVRPAAGEVRLHTGSSTAVLRSRLEAFAARVAYVPRERRDESLLETRSILDNFGLKTLRMHRRTGLVRSESVRRRFEEYVERLRIRAGHDRSPITSLSGGNQQKVILARWLAMHPTVLLLNDPTRGIDMAAKRDIYRILTDAAGEGLTVVMLSTEVEELVELMDRVLVFRENTLFTELRGDALNRTRLVASYFGRERDQ
jgi:ABC-type sugar transport system ATPase subunit